MLLTRLEQKRRKAVPIDAVCILISLTVIKETGTDYIVISILGF